METSVKYKLHKRFRHDFLYLWDLIFTLVGRDIKLQYKRSLIGIAWSFITPLVQLVVYYFVFQLVFSLDIPNYAAFTFIGMLIWTWFQTSLVRGAGAITENRDLVRQPGFPTLALPITSVITNLVQLLLSLPVLLIFLLYSSLWLAPTILFFPILVAVQFIFTLALTYLVAAINVTFRDTQHILGILLNILFYLTPIFYSASIVPQQYLLLYSANPLVFLVDAYRSIFLDKSLPSLLPLILVLSLSSALLFVSYKVFQIASHRFAEEL